MATVAQKIDALTAQVAELTEQVREMAVTRFTLETAFAAGMVAEQERQQGGPVPPQRPARRLVSV